ncbi:hypothetical protein BH09BAC2_BH09BAC2_07900 [soil metagenome]
MEHVNFIPFLIFLVIRMIIHLIPKNEEEAEIAVHQCSYYYIVNNQNISSTFDQYYRELLHLGNDILNTEKVTESYYAILDNVTELRKSGIVININLPDMKAAKEHLLLRCEYLGFWN